LFAALSSFVLGGLWYSPVFLGRVWNRENGSQPQPGRPVKVFGVSFVFSLIAAFCFAYWLGGKPSLSQALQGGLFAGFGIAAASLGINHQFAQRTFVLWLVDGGNHTTQFLLFGLVLGLWD
jgi:hypothetical protein